MSEALLAAEHVVKRYPILSNNGLLARRVGDLQAVEDVSFELRPGETLGIVGESGCGKSTLARLLVRLERPTSGRILFRGHDVAELGGGDLRRFRSKVQVVFQDPYSSLNPTMTVGQLVTEPWQIHHTVPRRERRARAEDLLESVGVDPGYYDRRPGELSGGERQRIGIARALTLSPDVVVCDEPASALDVSVQAQILTLLQELQQKLGLAYIFISHDLSVVRYLAHRVAVMYLGRLVEVGAARSIYEQPRHPYTRGLLEVARSLHGESGAPAGQPLLGAAADAAHPPAGCRFAPRCPRAAERCVQTEPDLRELEHEQFAACFFPESLKAPVDDA